MVTSLTGEAVMPFIDLMRHLKARGGPLGIAQKRQDDDEEA